MRSRLLGHLCLLCCGPGCEARTPVVARYAPEGDGAHHATVERCSDGLTLLF